MVDFKSLVPWQGREQVPTREGYFDPLNFRREMDNMFRSFFDRVNGSREDWSAGTPAIDVFEGDQEIIVTAEVPGVSEKDVDVRLSGDLLTISGTKKAEKEESNDNYSYVERRYGSFSRSLRLPFEIGDADVDATYDKGVLTIRIPKPADAPSSMRRIEVKSGTG